MLLNSRIRLTACIQNLQERIQLIELKQREIQQTEEEMKKNEEEMKKNEKFTVEVEEVEEIKEKIDAWWDNKAVTCNKCEENCHYPGCTMALSPSWCEVMKNGHCTSCRWKCPASNHVKEDWIYVNKTRKVKKTQQDMKKKYEENKAESEKKKSLMEHLQTEMKELKAEEIKWLDEVYQHVVNLEQIALNVNSLSSHVHLDFLIEKMKERRDTEKVKKLEEMSRKSKKQRCTSLSLIYNSDSRIKGNDFTVIRFDRTYNTTYGDIISKSTLISSGSPAVYQLRTKEEKFGTLTRKTVGEKNLNKTNRTILLVGETGAGKSTLINTLFNYTMGVKFEDNIWFEIVNREERSQTESQTSDVITYEIFGYEDKTLPYSLTIIDTPGYGSTEGFEKDVIVSQRLFDLFRSVDGVHEIDAVGLVLKAAENRVNDRQKYIFHPVMSLFGKDIEKNIVALITHSNGLRPENALKALEAANIKWAKNEKNQSVNFLFDNCQNTERTEETKCALEFACTITERGMKQFTHYLEKTKPQQKIQKLEMTKTQEDERPRKDLQHKFSKRAAAGLTLRTSNTSSRYQDIISKSTLISSGSPAVYQLRTKEEMFETLTRKTVGKKNLKKEKKNILLVGETGAGKSTLINSLVNYTMGVKFEDNIWFEIVERERRSEEMNISQTVSKTSDVIVYEIFGYEGKTLPYSLTIIDTPGYGDTRGIVHDVIVNQGLFDLFRSVDGVHELSAVGLVLKASLNRVNDQQMYIFDSVTSLFGKDIEKTIVPLITHSNGLTPKNVLKALEAANIKCVKNETNQPFYFLFDNCQKTQRTEEDELPLENAWKITERGIKGFTDFLKESKPQKLNKTVKVLNSRIRLTACIQNLQERIQLIELKQRETQQTEETLKKHEEEMKNNEELTVEVEEVYKEKEPVSGGMWGLFFYKGAVTCNICEETCHYPGCTMAWYPRDCEVMKRGHCTSCTGKCHVSDHVKEKWIYVNKTRKVRKTLKDLKEKYEENKSENEKKKSLMEHLQTEMEELKAEKIKLLDESYQHVVNLEQIALNVDSLSTHVHLDFLIEKMKERRDTEKVKKLEEMRSRHDEGNTAAWKYMFG
ncbi:uncharacterized protein LOC128371692%2C partial [Scomber scombrus]|uniref:Uncharacterized protein LOC128371692, partial n=1 Tax=Scomber scombrus TaxID=13677 RepID=A0AAV1QDC9_SCOSC